MRTAGSFERNVYIGILMSKERENEIKLLTCTRKTGGTFYRKRLLLFGSRFTLIQRSLVALNDLLRFSKENTSCWCHFYFRGTLNQRETQLFFHGCNAIT